MVEIKRNERNYASRCEWLDEHVPRNSLARNNDIVNEINIHCI